jgi:hypothetical protein
VTDPRTHLAEVLGELHEALASARELDDEAIAELRSAADEISEALERSGDDAWPSALRSKLSDALERFEIEHPRITSLVGRVADALADLGI